MELISKYRFLGIVVERGERTKESNIAMINGYERQKIGYKITAWRRGELMCMLSESKCPRMKDANFNCEECPSRQLTDLQKAFLLNLDKYDDFENLDSKFWRHIYADKLAISGIMTASEARAMTSALNSKSILAVWSVATENTKPRENKYFTLTEWGKKVFLKLRPDLMPE